MARHTLSRSLHDVGLAAWFGGSLMGAVGLNGATGSLADPAERSAAATVGWSRWAPVNAAAIGAHLVGAVQLLRTERGRLARQEGVARSSTVKTVLTGAALATTAYSGLLNRKMAAAGRVAVQGATEPGPDTPPDVARTQKQLQAVQWLIPGLTGALISVTSWQSEQMRPKQMLRGSLPQLPAGAPALAGAATATAVLVRALRRRSSKAKNNAQPDHAQTVAELAAQSRTHPSGTPSSTGTVSGTPVGGLSTTADTPAGAFGAAPGTTASGTTAPGAGGLGAGGLGGSDQDALVIKPAQP